MTQSYIHGVRTYCDIDAYTDPAMRASIEAMARDQLEARLGPEAQIINTWHFWHVEEVITTDGTEPDFIETPTDLEHANAATLTTEVNRETSVLKSEDYG